MKNNRICSNKNIIYSSNIESDENFCFIVGYTSNGFPYGITWGEADDLDYDFKQIIELSDESEEIPF